MPPLRRRPAALPLLLLAQALSAAAGDPRMGVMTHFAQYMNPSWADVTSSISVSAVRDELYWSSVEETPGAYAFPASFDAYMARLSKDGITPLIELDFANPLYDGGNTPYTPAGLAAYANYGVAVLNHYGSQIQAVEIWNEYNGSFCTGPAAANRAATYTAMLKQAYTQIKAVRPDVTVVGGATSGTPLPYWEQLMQAGALPYMDALSIHPYRFDSPPEGIESDVAQLQALVKQYNKGQAKPIWVTEIGWQEQAAPLLVDDPTLAKYVARTYALLFSAGVQNVYWYMICDWGGEAMGLFDADGTPKSAAFAMANLIGELDGAPFVRRENTPANVYSVLFQRSNGTQVRILWSLASRAVALTGVTKALDMLGNPISTSGNYTLTDAPIFVEGSVTGVPAPAASDEYVVASSSADFSGVQGNNGWTYGFVEGGGAFTLLPTYTSDEWNYYWEGAYPYLEVSAADMHPSDNGATPVSVVRRWTSTVATQVRVTGSFQGNTSGGDGVGVAVLLDGQPIVARTLIGASYPGSQPFDLSLNVSVGSTIDFVVDDGPSNNMNFDATGFSAEILATNASNPHFAPAPEPAPMPTPTPTPTAGPASSRPGGPAMRPGAGRS